MIAAAADIFLSWPVFLTFQLKTFFRSVGKSEFDHSEKNVEINSFIFFSQKFPPEQFLEKKSLESFLLRLSLEGWPWILLYCKMDASITIVETWNILQIALW